MRVLVTGNTGYLGSSLLRLLKLRGSDEIKEFSVHSSERDILNDNDLLEATKGIEAVYHLAGILNYTNREEDMEKVNVIGTSKLISACKKNKVRMIIFSSTQDVYLGSKKERVTEGDMVSRAKGSVSDEEDMQEGVEEGVGEKLELSIYARTKLKAERELLKGEDKWKDSSVRIAIARMSVLVGKGMPPGSLIHTYVHDAAEKGKVVVWGKGKRVYDLLSVDDAAKALLMLTGKAGVFNVGSGKRYTTREIACTLKEITGCKVEFQEEKTEPHGFFMDISQLITETDFRPLSLKETLKRAM